MFDDDLEAALGSSARLTQLVVDNHTLAKRYECRRLVLAAAWADAHTDPLDHADSADQTDTNVSSRRRGRPDEEGFIRLGGPGTPWISESCPAELGVLQQLSIGSARSLVADALDLRHRLPRLWARVVAGDVHAWKARQVASRSRYLGLLAVAELDRLISHQLELVCWTRFEKILDATLLQVDPVLYGQRAEEAKTRRGVWAGESAQGLRTLIIRACQGDTAVFLAAVNRVADRVLVALVGQQVGARRAKAIGILGNPAAALDLLNRHLRQREIYDDEWGYAADPNETSPWEQASSAGWADRRSRHYDQPAPSDPDYHRSQQAPPDDQFPPDESLPPDQPLTSDDATTANEPPAPDGTPATDEPSPEEPLSPIDAAPGRSREPLLPVGRLELRPVTRADRDASRPKALIVFHLTDEAVRAGRGVVRTEAGPITVDQLRQFLTDTDAGITITPVLDPAGIAPVDSYEIPSRMRRGLDVRHPGSVFPFGGQLTGTHDLDHTRPYRPGGPPQQTSLGNLGPLTRSEHRAKTIGRWSVRQPEPGTYLWRSPNGWIALATNQGTIMLGTGRYARQLWRNAGQPDVPTGEMFSSGAPDLRQAGVSRATYTAAF